MGVLKQTSHIKNCLHVQSQIFLEGIIFEVTSCICAVVEI